MATFSLVVGLRSPVGTFDFFQIGPHASLPFGAVDGLADGVG